MFSVFVKSHKDKLFLWEGHSGVVLTSYFTVSRKAVAIIQEKIIYFLCHRLYHRWHLKMYEIIGDKDPMLTTYFLFLGITPCSLGICVIFWKIFFWCGLPYRNTLLYAEHSLIDVHKSQIASNQLIVCYLSFKTLNIYC